MKVNVGSIDKIVRVIIGFALIAWGFYEKNWLGAIGLIPLVTGILSWCPLYTLLGIRTCSVKND